MSKTIQAISQARDFEIEEMMDALLQRYQELFPDWEVSVISLEKKAIVTDKSTR